ncbi:unnamed protein product [Amaranthus hypochondriacus]
MAKKRIVLKLGNSNKKSRAKILQAVTKVEGVEKLEMNGEKGILTVVGEVEPVPIFKALKKTGVTPEIVSVGPPIPQRCGPYCNCSSCQLYGHQLQKTWNEPVNTCSLALPCSCNRTWCNCKQCELVAVDYPPTDNTGQCSIQ